MKLRVYPRLRYLKPIINAKDWGKFVQISAEELKDHFNNYWPMLKLNLFKDYIEIQVNQWFYDRYMICYDHTIYKDGQWRNGTQKI